MTSKFSQKLFQDKKKVLMFSSLSILSFLTIFLTSKNSPLYLFNDWVDVNAFMTVGKGWINGLIPYRDLFEQKGPILYVIYAVGNAISNTYFGVFILETLLFFCSLLLVYRIARRYLNYQQSFLTCVIMSWILTLSPYFTCGGSAEELSYVFIFYSIYLLLKLIDNQFKITRQQSFIAGLCFAMLFWIKYTMIGSYLGAFLILVCVYLYRKDFRNIISMLCFSLLGFFIVTAPIIIYFVANQALSYLKFCYFTSNISLYPGNVGATIYWKIFNAIHIFIGQFSGNVVLLFLFILMLMYLLGSNKIFEHSLAKITYCTMYLGLIVSTFFGGRGSMYYFVILLPFGVLPVIALIKFFISRTISGKSIALICIFFLVLIVGTNQSILTSRLYPDNRSYTFEGKYSQPFQQSFAKIINSEKNPTLLNYGTLDLGLYHSADVLPINRFFERQNITDSALPEMMNEQNRIVSNRKVKFVVIQRELNSDEKQSVPENIRENYTLVAQQDQCDMNNASVHTYRLYKVKR